MPKIIMLIKRKPGLTQAEFKEYYERVHAPLARRVLVHMSDYTRNYLAAFPGQPEPPFDCITELWFEDQQSLKASLEFGRSSEGAVLAEDEVNFVDREQTKVFLATEAN
ncbi:EthD family reductase [Pseudomonas sp. BN414]|uniref:EthD domain-containing protein n=1 Tax=Pseudomonas sp. BN414 TaxID=2567888 RepID=UPI002456CDA8|nr:EthD domain-containing protein [Pseudomonas sp. BN414]MDH4565172.1 EthD family reductase [Pseudomonas sp. BN414]